MFEKELVIDARGHMYGRLASKVAKEILRGQRVAVVRTELLNISGSQFRNNIKFHEKLNKRNNTNPRRNFKHYRTPSRMFWRSLRGMLPHKSPRGKAALDRLKVFEGIPYPYDHKKRMVVPEALKVLRMKQHRNFCVLGDLANQNGWNKKELVETLEAKRKARSAAFWEAKQKKMAARKKADASADPKIAKELATHGF